MKADGSDANSLRSVDAKFVPAYHSLPLHFESRSATAMDDFLMQVVADLRRLQVFDESSLLSRARELVSQAAVESAYSLFGYRPLPLSGAKGAAAAAAASSGSASGDSPAQVESCKLSFVQLKSQKSHEGSVQVYLSDKGKLPLISEAKFRPADGSALSTFLCGRYGKVRLQTSTHTLLFFCQSRPCERRRFVDLTPFNSSSNPYLSLCGTRYDSLQSSHR